MIDFIDEKQVSYMPIAIKYGVIGTLISIGVTLAMYMADMLTPANNVLTTIITTLIYIGTLVLAIKTYRDTALNGFVSFGRAFGTGFMTTAVMAIIGAIWTYIFMGFIAPDMIDMIKEAQAQSLIQQGMDEDEVEQALEMASSFMSPGIMAISSVFMSLFSGLIISLIVAAIMKKDHPATV